MASFIAFCENPRCGAVFEVSNLIGGEGNATIHMTGSKVGPCPVCKSYGYIPDGVYQYANNAVSLLTGPETSVRVLQQVQDFLRSTKASTKEDVLKKVGTISPRTAEALEKAPDLPNFMQWLLFLIALLGLAIQVHTSYFKNNDIEKQFRDHLLQENKLLRQEQIRKSEPYKRDIPKMHRNAPCPCGSGKKYKKCCQLTEV